MSTQQTRILLVDDHALVRDGLRRILDSVHGFHVVGEAVDGDAALKACGELGPDVVLMDLTMPGTDAVKVIELLTGGGGNGAPAVLALTMHESVAYALRALRAGARGYVLKGTNPDELVEAINSVLQDKLWVAPSLRDEVLAAAFRRTTTPKPRRSPTVTSPQTPTRPQTDDPGVAILTDREFEVFRRLAMGATNREIAGELLISTKTVDTHRANILDKLKLRNNAELTLYAVRNQLVPA